MLSINVEVEGEKYVNGFRESVSSSFTFSLRYNDEKDLTNFIKLVARRYNIYKGMLTVTYSKHSYDFYDYYRISQGIQDTVELRPFKNNEYAVESETTNKDTYKELKKVITNLYNDMKGSFKNE